MNSEAYGKAGFAVGTGRCGTKFLAEVIAREPQAASVHERNPLNEAFHRYCQWYKLPVDHEGFLVAKEKEITEDLATKSFSFEASAHLSLSIVELYERFDAKFLFMVRRPDMVVNSYLRKGWYEQTFVGKNHDLALGYQENRAFHHFLGRIAPRGDKFVSWNAMSRIGRLAWYWNALNRAVFEQLGSIPETHWRLAKLEELNYARYLELTHFLGFVSEIGQAQYERIAAAKPNSLDNLPKIEDWPPESVREFEDEVWPMAERLGYEYHVETLRRQESGRR